MRSRFYFFLLILSWVSAYFGCHKTGEREQSAREQILAIVAEDTIYVNDFIRRCEYTIRPDYCQSDQILDKRICLNSLIAEKLFAREAQAENTFAQNETFHALLQGIQEQAMGEELLYDTVVDNIKIPEAEIHQAWLNSKKIVHTEGILIPDSATAWTIYQDAKNGMDFGQLAHRFPGVSEPISADVKWGQIDAAAQQAIFSDRVQKGTILAPLKTDKGYRLIKVTGWSEAIELSPGQIIQQKENIAAKLRDYYIQRNSLEYKKKIMQGKRIDFDKQAWAQMVNELMPLYVAEHGADLTQTRPENPLPPDRPFIKIDHQIWTIGDFRKAIQKHPLAINMKSIAAKNFPARLRAAIAGLLTDTYLIEIAYQQGYDQSYHVKRTVAEWKTAYLFLFHRDRYLKEQNYQGNIETDYYAAFDGYLTPYLDRLKIKYDSQIQYNPAALEKVELTQIPMIVYKAGGAWRFATPVFPVVTNSGKTNYKRFE